MRLWYLIPVVVLVLLVLSAPIAFRDGPEEAAPAPVPREPSETEKAVERQQRAIAAAYDKYGKKVAQVWGEEAVVPDARRDVVYRDNLRQRSIVDYEQGVVAVEVAMPPDEADDHAIRSQRLASAVAQTLRQAPDERSIEEIAEHPEPPHTQAPALLTGLVGHEDGRPFTPEELEDFTRERVRAMALRALNGDDGNERVVVSTQFKMVPEHLRVLAERFRHSVERYAQEHEMPAPLIYAIIETESAFNPLARSPIPAFGLMQLVPTTGARDAYKFLYDKDIVVQERYLYVADKNVELGTAYLHLLYYNYFKRIKNRDSRLWATIAAYNAGPRNVIESFSGEYSRRRYASSYSWKRHAINKINRMDSNRVYAYLRKHMPYRETRDYLKKVRTRMPKYADEAA